MAAPGTLIETLAHLQQQRVSVAYARHLLLDYARKSARARLGLLFRLDRLTRQLVLVEQCGRAPTHTHTSEPAPISPDGLFGAALHQAGAMRVSDSYNDPRSLPGERSWTWPGGQVWLCATGGGLSKPGARGIMVLCNEPEIRNTTDTSDTTETAQTNSEILICAALLGAYLEENSDETQAAIDRERSRIARDIHDGAAQGIAHAIHTLEFAQGILEKQPKEAQREILRARETLLASLDDLRHDISTLLPAPLEQANFDEAIRTLLDDFRIQQPAITLRCDDIQVKHMPPSLEVPLYRFLQEALNNVRKHAHASHVSVQLQTLPDLLVAQVSDDGIGFDAKQMLLRARSSPTNGPLAHLGLHAMRERIEQARGVLDILSTPGAGTILKVRFPLALPPVPLTNREREVLRLLAHGATNRAIANTLSVSTETVKSHVHHIMQKLQVKDRTQAAVLATRKQWV